MEYNLSQKVVDMQVQSESNAGGITKGRGPSTAQRYNDCREAVNNTKSYRLDA